MEKSLLNLQIRRIQYLVFFQSRVKMFRELLRYQSRTATYNRSSLLWSSLEGCMGCYQEKRNEKVLKLTFNCGIGIAGHNVAKSHSL